MANSLIFLPPTRREEVEVKQKARLSPEGRKQGLVKLPDFSYSYSYPYFFFCRPRPL